VLLAGAVSRSTETFHTIRIAWQILNSLQDERFDFSLIIQNQYFPRKNSILSESAIILPKVVYV
jgi:hypothetical protein